MIEDLQILAECDKPWAAKRAKLALDIKEQFDGGGLDEWEYQEMMTRIVEDNALDNEADDLDIKSTLVISINQVAGII